MRYLAIFFLIMTLNAEAGIIRDWTGSRPHTESPTQMKKLSDIIYGVDKKQKIDLYLPNNPKDAPIIVMVHGGGWHTGDKKSDNVVSNKRDRWVPKGVIFASINYRLLPKSDPLVQAYDIAQALAYIQTHGSEWGGDTSKIILMGHSAGGHLVSLLSANPSAYSSLGLKPWLGTVSLDSAVMDLPLLMKTQHYDLYDEAFGTDAAYWEANSPYHRLQRDVSPMLLVCSTERPDKPCIQAEHFAKKVKELGGRIEIAPQPLTHGEINDELGKSNGYTDRVEQFMVSLGVKL